MKTIGIFYLSGTGNTKAIAELFEKEYKNHEYQCDVYSIEDIQKGRLPLVDYAKYDVIGVGSPIYGSNAVPLVETFVEKLPLAKASDQAFIFLTGADFISINKGASYKLRHILNQKGYQLVLDKIYPMGSNWFVKYEDEMAWQLYLANKRKIGQNVQKMLHGHIQVEAKGLFPSLCSFLGKSEHYGAKILSKGFAINDQCIDCGKCIKNCPTSNISKKNEKLIYGNHCLLCMKCMYYCPVDAIYLKRYKSMGVKNGYRFEDLMNNSDLKGDFLTSETKGYFKHFYTYTKD